MAKIAPVGIMSSMETDDDKDNKIYLDQPQDMWTNKNNKKGARKNFKEIDDEQFFPTKHINYVD